MSGSGLISDFSGEKLGDAWQTLDSQRQLQHQ